MVSKKPLPYVSSSGQPADDVAPKSVACTGPSQDFLDRTLEVWEPIAGVELTREDARQMVENVSRFFDVLLEWDEAADSSDDAPTPGEANAPPSNRSSPE